MRIEDDYDYELRGTITETRTRTRTRTMTRTDDAYGSRGRREPLLSLPARE
jgi:hypothetical protein